MNHRFLTAVLAVWLVTGMIAAAQNDGQSPDTVDIYDMNIVKQFDVNPETLMVDGWKAYQDKDYERAARFYLAYLQNVKNDASNIYNLACCYGLLGKAELAAAWVEKAVEAGWEDLEHLKNDPDFNPVRDSAVFKEMVAKLEKKAADKKGDPGTLLMVPSRSMIPMYVKLPADYDPAKTYPLVVGLHGYGDNVENFAKIWDSRDVPIDCIYAAMEAPYAFKVGKELGYSWFIRMDPETYGEVVSQAGEMTDANVLAGIAMLKEKYPVGKVYLTGFSQGAGLTFITGLKHPELFAGIAPFGGWLDTDIVTEDDIAAAKALPVLIVHGTEDTMVEFDAGKKAEELLKKHGLKVTLMPFEGGHVVPAEGLTALKKMVAGE